MEPVVAAAEEITEIVHSFTYINAGKPGGNGLRPCTICLVEYPNWYVNASDTETNVVFISSATTPRHGCWSFMTQKNELHICFNARYGISGFEYLHPVVLFRVGGDEPEWKGLDNKGNRIVLEHIQSVERAAEGPWQECDKL